MTREELILLLKKYKENKAKLKLKLREKEYILRQLESIKETDLEATSFGLNSDIHSKNRIADKVGNVASNSIDIELELKQKLKDVEIKIEELNTEIEEIDIRLEALRYKEKKILVAYYIDGCTYEDIGNRVYYELFNQTRSTRNIQDIVEKATQKMLKI